MTHRLRDIPAPTHSCGKRRFRTERQALNHLWQITSTNPRATVPVRAYLCDGPTGCYGFHLTSQELL